MSLTTERKAELFDYLASRLEEMKLQLSFGGNEWLYHERGTPEELADLLETAIDWESDDGEFEDEDEDDED